MIVHDSIITMESIATVAFNGGGWGCTKRSLTASAIQKAQSAIKFEVIKWTAKEFCKGNTHVLESLSTPEAPEVPFDDADEWANLADNNSNND